MDTYTTALFLKTQTKTRNGFEQRQLEPKGYGGTRSLNASVLQTTKNKNPVFMVVYVVYILLVLYTTYWRLQLHRLSPMLSSPA
jgi:hypothetical protein